MSEERRHSAPRLSSALVGAILFWLYGSAVAADRTYQFNIPAESLSQALTDFSQISHQQIIFSEDIVRGRKTPGLRGRYTTEQALRSLLAGTSLRVEANAAGVLMVLKDIPTTPSDRMPRPDGVTLETITVTGTILSNVAPLFPLTTITGKELLDQGYSTTAEAFEQLPENFKAGISAESNELTQHGLGAANNATFASGVNLRGLGPDSTLVLLNGLRLPSTAFAGATDISAIPISAIDRIEILADGASSTYGSDAVAGVVNIITKSHYDGLESGARAFSIADGKTSDYGAYVLGGHSWNTGNFVLDYDYQKQDPLFASARSFADGALAPFSLLPRQETSSFYGTVQQQFRTDLTTSADLTYSRRAFNAPSDWSYGFVADAGTVRQLAASAAIDYSLPFNWHFNITGQYGSENDRTTFDYYGLNQISDGRQNFTLSGIQTRVDGPIMRLPGGTVHFAVGLSNAWEHFKYTSASNGSIGIAIAPSRNIFSAYSELLVPLVGAQNSIPLVRSLDVDLSGRYDKYSDFGSTSNPKVGARWVVNQVLALHGEFSTAFKAPTLYESSTALDYGYVVHALDPAAPGGSLPALIVDGTNPDLTSETAHTYSAGITLQPGKSDSTAIDLSYFMVSYRNRIERLLTVDSLFSDFVVDAAELGSYVNLSPTPAQIGAELTAPGRQILSYAGAYTPQQLKAIAYLGYENAAANNVDGLDAGGHYDTDTRAGHFHGDATLAYFLNYTENFAPASPGTEIAGLAYNPARFRGKLNLSWQRSGWILGARFNYTGGSHNPQDLECDPTRGCPVSSWTTVDLNGSYSIPPDSFSWLNGLRMGLDIQNVFDRNPPYAYDPNGVNYDPTNANPLGRSLSLSVSKRW